MSLRVWLPLTKDLRNQGLDDVTITNNGATFNSAGKLGGCYSVDNVKRIGCSNCINLGTTFSIAFWSKINSKNTDWGNIFKIYKDGTDYIGMCLAYTTDTNPKLGFHIYRNNGSNAREAVIDGYKEYSLNEWFHTVITVTPTKAIVYKNSEVFNTFTISKTFPSITNYSLWLGKNGISNGLDCSINDVRIYDHCLSPLEVKKLAQGLVLHYPLNNNGLGGENLVLNTANMTTISNKCTWRIDSTCSVADGIGTIGGDGNWRAIGCHNGLKLADYQGQTVTVGVDIRSVTGDATYRPVVEFRTSNSQFGTSRSYRYKTVSLNCSDVNNIPTTEWHRFYCSFTITASNFTAYDSSGNNNVEPDFVNGYWGIHIYNHGSVDYQIKNIKLELGSIATPWCPNSSDALATTMGLNGTTEYDISGFCNNGTRTGTFSWTSDTPKYSVSQYFNGSSYILTDSSTFSWFNFDKCTIAVWMKPTTTPASWAGTFGIAHDNSSSNKSFVIGNYGGKFTVQSANGGWVNIQSSALPINEWHHCVATLDGTTIKMYFDGELVNTYTTSWGSTTVASDTRVQVGNDLPGSDEIYQGYYSDARIYATSLSADDVLDLYNNTYTVN